MSGNNFTILPSCEACNLCTALTNGAIQFRGKHDTYKEAVFNRDIEDVGDAQMLALLRPEAEGGTIAINPELLNIDDLRLLQELCPRKAFVLNE
jgi:hypothetical protein